MEKYFFFYMFINIKSYKFNVMNIIKELGKIIDLRWVFVVNWFDDYCIYIYILGD